MPNYNPKHSQLKKFKPKWINTPTKAIRVPEIFADRLMRWAKEADSSLVAKSVAKLNDALNFEDNQGLLATIDDALKSLSVNELDRYLVLIAKLKADKNKPEQQQLPEQRIEIEKDRAIIYFPYDKSLISKVKSLDSARFSNFPPCWTINLKDLPQALKLFPFFYCSSEVIALIEQWETEAEAQHKSQLESKLNFEQQLSNLVDNLTLNQPLVNNWTLFDHQKKAVKWLATKNKFFNCKGAILADQMGLGKTLEALHTASLIKSIKPLEIIVICPASLKKTWADLASELAIDLAIYSWAKFPSEHKAGEFLLICDEAHYAQNLEAARTKKVMTLAASANCFSCWLLTGTPIKNGRPINLFPLLKICDHPYSNDLDWYERHFCNAHMGYFGWDNKGAKNLEELHQGINSILLRRTKAEVLDLPPKIRSMVQLKISKSLKEEYKAKLNQVREAIRQRRENPDNYSHSGTLGELALIRHAGSLAKIEAASQFCQSIIEQGSQVIIFTEFVDTAKSLAKSLEACLLIGETSLKERGQIVEDFQSGKYPALVGTIGAGGVGLTLTAASYVVLVDRPWTPGDAQQAEDRVHRISQTETVFSYWLQLPFGLDAEIDSLLEQKQTNIDLTLTGGKQQKLIESEIRQFAVDYLNSNKI